jgi:hypothetical protein
MVQCLKPGRFVFGFIARILKSPGGAAIDANDNVSVVNSFGHASIESVVIEVQDMIVSNNSVKYKYRAPITVLMTYNAEAKASHQRSGVIYIKDTAGHMDTLTGANNTNDGYIKRKAMFAEGAYVPIRVHLDCDICNISSILPTMINMRITITHTSDAFCLLAPNVGNAAPTFTVERSGYYLETPRVTPITSITRGYTLQFEKPDNMVYIPMTRVVTKAFGIPVGVQSHTIDNAFNGKVPKRITYGLVRNDAYNGSYTYNPFNFQNYTVTQTAVYVNGISHPTIPFTPQYTGDRANWIREYSSLFDGMGIYHGNRGLDITYEDYPNGYCLYCLDLTPTLSAGDSSHATLVYDGDVRMEFQFQTALPHAVSCVVYAEFDSSLQIDKSRNVFIDYNPLPHPSSSASALSSVTNAQ